MTTDPLFDIMKIEAALEGQAERLEEARKLAFYEIRGLQKERDDLADKLKVKTTYVTNTVTTGIPRVITAGELKEGQLICIHRGQGWGVRAIGTFESREGDVVTMKTGGSGVFSETTKFHTIVLLADTPTDQQEPERLTVKWSGERRGEVIDPQDIRDGDVVDKWRMGVRVAQDVTFDQERIKDVFFYNDDTDEFRLVHRPTPAPVTAETIRASEVPSTWDDRDGDNWEWDGENMRLHRASETLHAQETPEYVIDSFSPLARSSAAPRGDYGKRELPTEPGEVILVTEFGGLYDATEPVAAYRTNGITWRRLDQEPWPGDYLGLYAPDEEITGWRPAYITSSNPATARERTDQK